MNLVGFDLGSYTLDIFVLMNGEFVKEDCTSLDLGMGNLVTEILNNFALQGIERQSDLLEHRVKKVLLTGDSAYFGTKLMTFQQLVGMAPTCVERLAQIVLTRSKEGLKLLPLGGGARIISHILRIKSSDVVHIQDPEMANIVGMVKEN
jgi:hypothetical protein